MRVLDILVLNNDDNDTLVTIYWPQLVYIIQSMEIKSHKNTSEDWEC